MKNRLKIFVLLITTMIISLFCGINAQAAKKNTNKYYKIEHCKIAYKTTSGQVRVEWSEPSRTTDKVATLYYEDEEIAEETFSGNSWDVSEYVENYGTGKYYCTVYPVKLGDSYTKKSSKLTINETKYKKVCNFDRSVYEIDTPSWGYNKETGQVTAIWYTDKKNAGAKIRLYKGTTAVDEWLSVSGTSYDISQLIAKKGSGTYTYKVYPSALGDNYIVEADEFYVDADMAKKIKAYAAQVTAAEEAKKLGWYKERLTTIWHYYKTPGVMAKNEWISDKGKLYHFTSAGIMQTGWQSIDNKYYYFDTSGALFTSGVTPDGYTVNALGERLDDAGQVVSSKGDKKTPANHTTLSKCSISVSESGKEPGVVKNAEFKGGTGFTVSDVVFAKPYEQWTAGSAVGVTLTITASANYSFGSSMTISARNCKSITSTGNTAVRRVSLYYYPKMQLTSPGFLYMDSQETLCWKPVEKASKYKIEIYENGEKTVTDTTTENSYDVLNGIDFDLGAVSIKLYAMAGSGKTSYYTTSAVTQIEDLEKFAAANTISGEIKWSSKKMKYLDESGEAVTGWTEILGSWYYFDKNGYAKGPGWFKDEDDLWYYFDTDHKMMTGNVNDGKADYFLNDGSNPDLPLGAWKQP